QKARADGNGNRGVDNATVHSWSGIGRNVGPGLLLETNCAGNSAPGAERSAPNARTALGGDGCGGRPGVDEDLPKRIDAKIESLEGPRPQQDQVPRLTEHDLVVGHGAAGVYQCRPRGAL